jgi:hypothetical protein
MSSALSINLEDPHVQQMLGAAPLATGKRREVVQLAGDAHHGLTSHYNLAAMKQEVVVVYGDLFMTVDVYAVPGEPLKVHLYCPRCHKHSTVPGTRKAIDFEPGAANPARTLILASGRAELVGLADKGRLSIEAFECPWEMGDDRHIAGGLHTGVTLCRLRIAIDNNQARSA